MSNSLEKVVRPFQAPSFGSRAPVPPPPPGSPLPNIVVNYGQPSTLKAKAIGVKNLNSGKTWTEQSRQTHVVRVENPSDPDQFVDVERIDKAHLKDELGAEHFLELNNT